MSDEQRARELLKPHCVECDDHDYPFKHCRKCWQMTHELEAAFQAVRAEEREAIERRVALLAIGTFTDEWNKGYQAATKDVIEVVRKRGQP